MTTRKRNAYLEASDSESHASLASDREEESRAQRVSKRRRIEVAGDVSDEDDIGENEDEEDEEDGYEEEDIIEDGETQIREDSQAQLEREIADSLVRESSILSTNQSLNEHDTDDDGRFSQEQVQSTPQPSKPSTSKATSKSSPKTKTTKTTTRPISTLKPIPPKKDKSGIIYLSRIPPFMKPSTLRTLLSPLGPINRIFLTPESASTHSTRVRTGGNKKRSFTDGWVEFLHKSDAKLAAESLNAKPVGGKKGGWYRDDLWNLKYLKGFKWRHLTEQIANENAERQGRMRAELGRGRREREGFLRGVEMSKVGRGMERKRLAKALNGEEVVEKDEERVGDEGVDEGSVSKKKMKMPKQYFKQSAVKVKDNVVKEQPEEVQRVLAKIF